jgi:hypothetical protein
MEKLRMTNFEFGLDSIKVRLVGDEVPELKAKKY